MTSYNPFFFLKGTEGLIKYNAMNAHVRINLVYTVSHVAQWIH